MKYFCVLLSLLALCHSLPADEPVHERIEWIDIWVTDADKDDLPRVLLVGDSITRGYFGAVEKQLAGKAYCARLTTSKCVSDPTFNDDLLLLLKQYKFSVIHFNNGLHGWGYTEDQYRDGLSQTVAALKENSGGAQLIWATTTPVREKTDLQSFAEQTERVKERNKLAAEIMKRNGVSTNNLFELVEDHADWQSTDGVHFNAKGNEALAKQVTQSVSQQLRLAE
ncbi:SGNH/GDSL hydrolase family protein [Rubinisphaera italica]|uniref:GDSL-like Lipase/Acylhydrolase n=1 Tax=Rubinisphaera italica TaxID=2527969 RepID=A0A5C5XER9_9PLAN|nr:SGNH/GDSL hydrolase family protein [Rubinisphaera italica]TWT60921.1 GDSL-like Lipase/Acylhydrolase [Rubinisphaera italica]